jgi:nitroreductase
MSERETHDGPIAEHLEPPVPNNELTRILALRGTVRDFKPDPVPQSWANAIVEYGMRAPTSSNRQEYSVIQVHDIEARKQIAKIATNQQHIVNCPVFFAICADQNRVAHALGMHGKSYPSFNFEAGLCASIDAALVGLTMSYVAESFGLANVLIGAMRNNAVEIAKILKLPPRCYVVFGLCVGWAKAPALPKPRHDLTAVLHHDIYDPKDCAQAIIDYDRDLAAYYRNRGVETSDAAWSKVMSEKYSKPMRANLKQELNSLGFPFE